MQELIIIIIDALWRAGEEFEETADGLLKPTCLLLGNAIAACK
jgi:hypothetical protein